MGWRKRDAAQSHVTAFTSGSKTVIVFCMLFVYEKVDSALLASQGVPGQAVRSAARAGLRLPGRLATALLAGVLAYVLHRALSE